MGVLWSGVPASLSVSSNACGVLGLAKCSWWLKSFLGQQKLTCNYQWWVIQMNASYRALLYRAFRMPRLQGTKSSKKYTILVKYCNKTKVVCWLFCIATFPCFFFGVKRPIYKASSWQISLISLMWWLWWGRNPKSHGVLTASSIIAQSLLPLTRFLVLLSVQYVYGYCCWEWLAFLCGLLAQFKQICDGSACRLR